MIELPHLEGMSDFIEIKNTIQVPKKGGIYFFFNSEFEVMYIGKAKELRGRIGCHLNESYSNGSIHIKHNFEYIKFVLLDCPVDRDIYETYFINKLKPKLNSEKTFLYGSSRYDEEYNPNHKEKIGRWQDMMDKELDDFKL